MQSHEENKSARVKIQYLPHNLSYQKVGYLASNVTTMVDIRLLSVELHPETKTQQFLNLLGAVEKIMLDYLVNDEKTGLNINASLNDSSTRLHWVALLPFIKVADFWLKHITADITDSHGTTPLYVAALNSNTVMYQYLVQRGANPRKEHRITKKTPEEVLQSRVESLFIDVPITPKELKRPREETPGSALEGEPEKKAQRVNSASKLHIPLSGIANQYSGYTSPGIPSSPLGRLNLGSTSPVHFVNAHSPRGSNVNQMPSPRSTHQSFITHTFTNQPPLIIKPIPQYPSPASTEPQPEPEPKTDKKE